MTTTTSKTDRHINRAPKGGAISLVNGQWYRGGQYMPMVAEVVEARPAPLVGSSRQVAWASRLRREELARLDDVITCRVLFLNSPIRAEVVENRKALRRDLIARHNLVNERSASAIIGRRMVAMA